MSSDCTKCGLHEGAINVCIGGLGRKTAPFLVVVQGPDSSEDLAGKLGGAKHTRILIELLKEAGFSGEEVRITSAVRCTTPYGGPRGDEENACRGYLRTEIHEVRPKRIIAVGDAPLRVLCKRSGVMSVRGETLPLHVDYGLPELEVSPVYGIGMLAKTPNYRGVIVEDLRRARNHTLEPESIPWVEYLGDLPWGDTLAYDIETSFYIDGGDRIIQIQVASKNGVVVARNKDSIRRVALALVEASKEGKTIVGHNSFAFDAPRLEKFLNETAV